MASELVEERLKDMLLKKQFNELSNLLLRKYPNKIDMVIKFLKDKNPMIRGNAALLIGLIGEKNPDIVSKAIPVLVKIMKKREAQEISLT